MSKYDQEPPTRPRTDPGPSVPPRYPGTFMLALREAIAGISWEIRRWRGAVVDIANTEGEERAVGLENLYRRVRPHPRDQWPNLITEFFNAVSVSETPDELPTDLDGIQDQLMVRVGPPFSSEKGQPALWSYPLGAAGLVVNLVVDYDQRMVYVTEQMVEESGQPGEDWFQQGLANLRDRTGPDCFQEIDEESGLLASVVADAYDSSRALILDDLLPDSREVGCWVAVPGRDHLLVLPVSGPALPFVHLLKVLADKNFKDAPYAISNEVFWVYQGVWHPFPIGFKDQKVTIQPPEEFVEVLEKLGLDDFEPDEEAASEWSEEIDEDAEDEED